MITWGVASPRVARDAPEKNVTEVLNEAFQSFKSSLDDLVKQIEVIKLIYDDPDDLLMLCVSEQ